MLQRLVSLAATEGRNEELELSFSVFAVYVSHPSPLPNELLLSRIVSEFTPSQNLADVGMLRHVGSQP